MRMRMMAPLALALMTSTVAVAGGRPVTETCVNAGFRPGTPAFETCVVRVGGDDPMAALEGGELGARADVQAADAAADKSGDPLAAMVPAKPPLPGVTVPVAPAREEVPASFNTPTRVGGLPPTLPGGGGGGGLNPAPVGGGWWPTAPTAPTLPGPVSPTVPGTVPAWNFGGQ